MTQQHGNPGAGARPSFAQATADGDYPDAEYWRQQFRHEPYFADGDDYDDYAAAYEAGYHARRQHPDQHFAALEAGLRHEWEANKGVSRLEWDRARPAVRRAWERG